MVFLDCRVRICGEVRAGAGDFSFTVAFDEIDESIRGRVV